MLDTTILSRGRDNCRVHSTGVRPLVDKWLTPNRVLALYLEGWAEANPAKILDATDVFYGFYDPLVGCYSRRSLPDYFEQLQARFAHAGTISRQELRFDLRGPMDRLSLHDELAYWREAPCVGLTGSSQIKLGTRGVLVESVTYDLNLASNALSSSLSTT